MIHMCLNIHSLYTRWRRCSPVHSTAHYRCRTYLLWWTHTHGSDTSTPEQL